VPRLEYTVGCKALFLMEIPGQARHDKGQVGITNRISIVG
jgi:hypothetical protein